MPIAYLKLAENKDFAPGFFNVCVHCELLQRICFFFGASAWSCVVLVLCGPPHSYLFVASLRKGGDARDPRCSRRRVEDVFIVGMGREACVY